MRRSKELRRMAREAGLCDEWFGEWRDYSTQDQLIEKYVRGIDFCIKHEYPSLDYIKGHFSPNKLHDHGVYVDDWVSTSAAPSANKGVAVLLGKSMVTGETTPFSCSTFYVRHDSMMNFSSPKNASAFIHAYDNAEISIGFVSELSKVHIYNHSPNTKIIIERKNDNIKVVDKY